MKELTKTFTVESHQTALSVGSGTLEVWATPSAIAMAENTCMILCENYHGEEETTVGSFIDFKHLKPSVVASKIEVKAIVIDVSGRKISLSFELFENGKLIGKGNHNRAIVNEREFLSHIKQ